ncbi:hypothetical protein [Pseudomonas paeninsulae]|uniref:hypothetical protein n=1 Tax=Pseudomonas paeninsulae TaxID=3110772 RepID=UPI002D7926ED|nr:hypothetical protein [Pseudomonas sp. IT1137]
MLCHYLRHIDLLAVYEQLPAYEPGKIKPRLANIPPPLCDTLAPYFVEMAEAVCDYEYAKKWQGFEPIAVAAEVGDLIESELEGLECEIERDTAKYEWGKAISAPLADAPLNPGALEAFLGFASQAQDLVPAYAPMVCLLIYQYDALCSLHQAGNFESALSVFEAIAVTRETLTHCEERHSRDWRTSHEARERAALRHAPTNQQKAATLTEWDATSSDYESRADFSRIIGKRDGIKERTLYDWIASHEKSKA